MVGDLAIFMVKNNFHTRKYILEKGESMAFPLIQWFHYFKGMMGQPNGGFSKNLPKYSFKGR